jgi:outer membrane immunogenic protein
MKKFYAAIAAGFCVLGASPALANAEEHQGFRVGGLLGVSGSSSPFDEAEFTFGGVLGYDLALLDSFLFGVEVDLTSTSVNVDGFGERVNVNARQIGLAARGTYTVGPRTALFASAGYSNARISAGVDGITASQNFDGFRVGGGAEHKINSQVYSSLEYRFVDYEVIGGAHQLLLGAGLRF